MIRREKSIYNATPSATVAEGVDAVFHYSIYAILS